MEITRKEEEEKREIPPQIIVEEILSRLPVKPLARFRSVCKTWNSIIASDPKFAILQLKNSSTCFDHRQRVMLWDILDRSSVFFLENSKNQPLTSSNNSSEFAIKKINTSPIEVQNSDRCLIVASCDGLICMVDLVTDSILLWNPFTGETKRVSDPPSGIPPLYDRFTYGLGYDSSTDDYKLFRIKLSSYDFVTGLLRPNEVEVFSLRTNSWRQIQDFPFKISSLTQGVSINGALYWTGLSGDPLDPTCKVASLCLETEKYRLLNIRMTDSRWFSLSFGVQALGDKLAVYYPSNVGAFYSLFLINPCENSESWTKHTVNLHGNDWLTPLCLMENVEEVLFLMSGNQFGIYRFRDGTYRQLQIIGLPSKFRALTLSESLISPNTFKG